MKKILIATTIFVLVMIGVFIITINAAGKALEPYEQAVGKKVVYEGDTVTVVDFHLNDTFTLSNGVSVHASFVFNQK